MILVTKPFLPDRNDYDAFVSKIWASNYLTNNGPLVQELEHTLQNYFHAPYVLFTSNGTISLQIAIKSLELDNCEIITTPFSYVATTSCIVWENCKPVFADIDRETFNIDPDDIEKRITKNTKAILATHVFGNPCNIDRIEAIATKHNLYVIYDAAHCFAAEYKNRSVLSYGDISSISFHATKLFHTVEGGALVTKSEELKRKMSLMRNFGHNGFDVYTGVGINGKNSEFHAAMGLSNLKYISSILESRKAITDVYNSLLTNPVIKKQKIDQHNVTYNYAYYPVVFDSEATLLNVKKALEDNQIFPRRYFYPSLNTLEYVNSAEMPNSEYISKRILCLPIYVGLAHQDVERICSIINKQI